MVKHSYTMSKRHLIQILKNTLLSCILRDIKRYLQNSIFYSDMNYENKISEMFQNAENIYGEQPMQTSE